MRKDCKIDYKTESSTKGNSVAGSSEDCIICDIEEHCSMNVVSVSTSDRFVGKEREGSNHSAQSAEIQAARPDEGEVNPILALQHINVDWLPESQRERLSTLILYSYSYFTNRPRKCNSYEYQ
jgi:hypothetical protein